ncbi:MAG: glycosyl hydrolase [Christensenellales bacterium]|jgi:hypothetical protein
MLKTEKRVYGEQPFWFWNDVMDADEVRRQIFAMRDGGVKGFFLHPRQGMDLPYMSDRFIEMVGVAVEAAKEAGMEMWLYDEYPYPSGVGGGELLIQSDYVARTLTPFNFRGKGLIKKELRWGKVMYAKAFPVNGDVIDWSGGVDVSGKIGITYLREIYQGGAGLSVYTRKRFFTGLHSKQLYWEAPAGEWQIFIFIEHEIEDYKYFGSFVDPVNPKAMQDYIQFTHQRYYDAFPEHFGKTIKGIFTDETSPMSERGIMWSKLMPELFLERNGYDLIDYLPSLITDTAFDDEKFRYDFENTIIEAFIESFDKPIRKWCEDHGIVYTGEKPHMRLNQTGYMHLPGTDNGHQKVGSEPNIHPGYYRANLKAVASSAHFCGDGSTLCEAYHSTGWGMTLRDMRWMVDWMGVQGVNLFNPHAFFYSDDALRKHDAPPSAFESMPYWSYNRLYTEHVNNTTRITLFGERYANVLVMDPVIASWSDKEESQHRRPKSTRLTRVQRALSSRHVDYYVADTDVLATAAAEDGKISIKDDVFDVLIIPGMSFLEQSGADSVKKFLDAGVKIYCCESVPKRNITTGDDLDIDPSSFIYVEEADDLVAAVVKEIPIKYGISSGGDYADRVLAAAFALDGYDYIYTVNMYKEEIDCELWFESEDARPVSAVNMVTGKAYAVESTYEDGKVKFSANYAPFEPIVFCIGMEGEEKPKAQAKIDISLDEKRGMELKNHNLLRMAFWNADLGGNKAYVDSMPVIDQIISVDGSVRAVDKSGFGCLKRLEFPEMELSYEASFSYEADGEIYFAMEPGSINGDFKLYLNGEEIGRKLEKMHVYKRGNLACDISAIIKKGVNTVRVEVDAKYDHDGITNPLYIAGDFSVSYADEMWRLGMRVESGSISERIDGGLPFYSGIIDYDIAAELKAGAGKTADISIDGWIFEDAAELIINGESKGALAWNPYCWSLELPKVIESAKLRIANTLNPAFEGAHFDAEAHDTVFVSK